MPIRWLILLTSITAVAGGLVSLSDARLCTPLETANDCVTGQGYRALWSENGAAQAVGLFQEAVLHDPASPHRWFDLADALLLSGDLARAKSCARQGFALGSRVPSILLRTLNFAVSTGCSDDGMAAGGELLKLLPDQFDDVVFAQLSRAGCTTGDLSARMFPHHPDAARTYLWQLMRSGNVPAAAEVWEWMRTHHADDRAISQQYQIFLIEHQRSER